MRRPRAGPPQATGSKRNYSGGLMTPLLRRARLVKRPIAILAKFET
jgi:hypothetical protein